MSRITFVQPEQAPSPVKEMYSKIQSKMGSLPNIFKNMGNSSEALQAYLDLSEQLNKTSLSPKVRSQIALLTGQHNHCNYCLSAHTAIARHQDLKDDEIMNARKAIASDPKSTAILQLTKLILEKQGNVSEVEIQNAKKAGITEKEIVEIVLAVTLNIYTNYFNKVTGTPIDFPLAPELN